MFDTELLLQHTPEDAIIMMVNAENGTHFPTGTFEFGLPEVIDGRHTRIHMKARRSHHKLDEVPYDGEFDFEYYRLDLANYFQDVLLGYATTLPTSSQVVLDEIKRRLKQDFYLDDVVLEEIGRTNAAPYVLKAKVESLRWVGELEIPLSDTQDLNDFFAVAILSNGPTRMGPLDASPQLQSPSIEAPFVNATINQSLIAKIVPGNYLQDNPFLFQAIKQFVPIPGQALNPANSPWIESATPGLYNLHNARMVGTPYTWTGANPSNQNLTHVVEVELDPAYTLLYKDTQLLIPYRVDDFSTSDFTMPRLTRFGTKSLTDGSAYATWLNTIAQSTTITSLAGAGGPFLINGPVPYVAIAGEPGQRNLYGSIVIYNGQLRPQDSQPANPALNRVLVLALSPLNTAYKGNFSIHYLAPIVMPASMPNAFLNQTYNCVLTATQGPDPITYHLVSGALAPGHNLAESTGVVTGSATQTGVYRVRIEAHGANGVVVPYDYVYEVQVADLNVTGSIPDAVVGETIDFSYQVTGGIAPYQIVMISGTYPPSLTWNASLGRFTGTLGVGDIGSYAWTLSITDSRGNVQIVRQDNMKVEAA